jgi:hypothetical protein
LAEEIVMAFVNPLHPFAWDGEKIIQGQSSLAPP